MTSESTAPVLVLGLGNLLLGDDAAGLRVLEELRAARAPDPRVEFLDGGTQGLALLPWLADRRAVLLLDAASLGGTPGEVHVVDDARAHPSRPGVTAHETNAGGLLTAAQLTGECPAAAALVGIEPMTLRTEVRLSKPVRVAIPQAVAAAGRVLDELIATIPTEGASCTS